MSEVGDGPPVRDAEPRSTGSTPRNGVAAQLRRLTSLVIGRPITKDALDRAAHALEKVADELEQSATAGKRRRGAPEPTQHPQDFFPTSPVIGYASPLSPPVQIWAEDGPDGLQELHGHAWLDYQYEGPPTCVHGGVIAQMFDEMLGSVNILNGQGGFTGTLTIRFRRPTPLRSDLDLVARAAGRDGRKIFATGAILHDGEVTAEAEGIFIAVRPAQMVSIVTENAAIADGDVVAEEWTEELAANSGPVDTSADQTARSRPSQ